MLQNGVGRYDIPVGGFEEVACQRALASDMRSPRKGLLWVFVRVSFNAGASESTPELAALL